MKCGNIGATSRTSPSDHGPDAAHNNSLTARVLGIVEGELQTLRLLQAMRLLRINLTAFRHQFLLNLRLRRRRYQAGEHEGFHGFSRAPRSSPCGGWRPGR